MLTNSSTYSLWACKLEDLARHTFNDVRNVMHLRGRSRSDRRHGQCRACNLPAFKLTRGCAHESGNSPRPSLHKYLLAHVSLKSHSEKNIRWETPGSHDIPYVPGIRFVKPLKIPSRADHLPEVPFGNTAVSMAICPCSTRVKERRCSAVGVPKCRVRVTSVVPSRYCPRGHL